MQLRAAAGQTVPAGCLFFILFLCPDVTGQAGERLFKVEGIQDPLTGPDPFTVFVSVKTVKAAASAGSI